MKCCWHHQAKSKTDFW